MLPLFAMMGGSALTGIGNILGSRTQANAAGSAGQMGLLGSILAAQAAEQGYQRANTALSPYATAGNKSIDLLMQYLQGTGAQQAGVGGGGANLMSTFQPTQQQLESTPGYQWARSQALGAMANSGAARGMGSSGNLVQQIGQTATGLASQTFQQQLDNYLRQNQQAFGMLYNPGQLGAQAAGGIANAATGAATNIANAAMGGGQALGQGIMGAGNALAGGEMAAFKSAGNALQLPYMASIYGNNPASTAGGSTAFSSMMPDFLRYGIGGSGNLPSNVVGGLGDRAVRTYY